MAWACCDALQSEPEPEPPLPPSPLRLACCARARAVGMLCCTAVRARARAPALHCAWLVVRVLCYTAVRTRAKASRSPLRLASCACGRAVDVLCCTAVRARARAPVLHCAWLVVRVLCYTTVRTRARAPRSPLRLACCARGKAVGVLCCVLCSRGSALCNLLRVDLMCRITVGGDPTSSAPGLADALCNLLACPAATPVSARPAQRSVYTQYSKQTELVNV